MNTITVQPKNQSSSTQPVIYDLADYVALIELNGKKMWIMTTPENGIVVQAYDYKTELSVVPTDQGRINIRLA